MNKAKPHVCMLAAENDVIPGAKVGGIGDVIRDLPPAIAAEGATVSVIIPAYGKFHRLPGANLLNAFAVDFQGRAERIELYEVFAERNPGVRWLLLHHPHFAIGGEGKVYCDDDNGEPFSTDATKFALFSLAALSLIRDEGIGKVDIIHLHDWHVAIAAVLRAYDPGFESLRDVPCVYSIHNLALQGIRPLAGNPSSLQGWFPSLHYDPAGVVDPRWPHCINPMAAAIRLCSRVNTVSPTYASEILQPNNPARGFHGGEGLEGDLQAASEQGRLLGIINGTEYGHPVADTLEWPQLMNEVGDQVLRSLGRPGSLRSVDYLAHQRILQWQSQQRPAHVLTSVGRLTDQKMALLLEPMDDGRTALDRIIETIDGRGLFLLLGSGDVQLENRCQKLAAQNSCFIFINSYSQGLSDHLFAQGDLFLMPSSFEPCGISQMIAMRHGQPCLVHAVGGLCDTVRNETDGFHFSGDSVQHQKENLLARLSSILALRERHPDTYTAVARAASQRRFRWADSAKRYLTELYQ